MIICTPLLSNLFYCNLKMPACAIVGCGRRYQGGQEVRLFSLPKVISHQCDRSKELSSKRRAEWLSRINRKMTGKKVDGFNVRVCDRHFISGKPSLLFECTHPDWVPSVNLGYERKKGAESAVSRYNRLQERRRKSSAILSSLEIQPATIGSGDDVTSTLHEEGEVEFTHSRVDVCQDIDIPESDENTPNSGQFELAESQRSRADELPSLANLHDQPVVVVVSPRVPEADERNMKNHVGCQADFQHRELVELRDKYHESVTQKTVLADEELLELRTKYADQVRQNSLLSDQLASMTEKVNTLMTNMQQLEAERDMFRKDNEFLTEKNRKLKLHLKDVSVDEDSLRNDDEKTLFFTGLPSFELVKHIYDFVEVGVSHSYRNKLPKFTEFLITLMRLRLGILEQDLAYRYNVEVSTVSKICSRWIRFMSTRLEKLIVWPERTVMQRTIPKDFKAVFGDRFSVIIDCFEVFIDRPSSLAPRAETFSVYKHHNTVKFLIGITPQGTVCFVSKAWGGRASDKHITLHSGFLDNLLPGDVVLADRGFDIDDEVALVQAKIAIPAFTKGKTQLSFEDVRKTREIANIRIHVERMIGFIKRKFRVLGSMLPNSYLQKPKEDDTPPIDHIIKICCGLANLCPPLIRDDETNLGSDGDSDDVLRILFRDYDADEPMLLDHQVE